MGCPNGESGNWSQPCNWSVKPQVLIISPSFKQLSTKPCEWYGNLVWEATMFLCQKNVPLSWPIRGINVQCERFLDWEKRCGGQTWEKIKTNKQTNRDADLIDVSCLVSFLLSLHQLQLPFLFYLVKWFFNRLSRKIVIANLGCAVERRRNNEK